MKNAWGKVTVGGVIGASMIMSWMASDNIMQGTSIMTRDLSWAVKSGAITKEKGLELLNNAQEWKDRGEKFVKINSKINPILWPFGKILLVNAAVAQQQLDIQREKILMET